MSLFEEELFSLFFHFFLKQKVESMVILVSSHLMVHPQTLGTKVFNGEPTGKKWRGPCLPSGDGTSHSKSGPLKVVFEWFLRNPEFHCNDHQTVMSITRTPRSLVTHSEEMGTFPLCSHPFWRRASNSRSRRCHVILWSISKFPKMMSRTDGLFWSHGRTQDTF